MVNEKHYLTFRVSGLKSGAAIRRFQIESENKRVAPRVRKTKIIGFESDPPKAFRRIQGDDRAVRRRTGHHSIAEDWITGHPPPPGG